MHTRAHIHMQDRAEQTGRRRRKSDEEEEEAMRMAQDESLALRLQQEDEEASLQAALRELELQERGGGEQQRNAEQEEKEKEKEEEREEGENRTQEAEPIVDKHEGDRYDCQICMEEYPYYEVFLVCSLVVSCVLCVSVCACGWTDALKTWGADSRLWARVLCRLYDELSDHQDQGAINRSPARPHRSERNRIRI